jgi:hypothetical protein
VEGQAASVPGGSELGVVGLLGGGGDHHWRYKEVRGEGGLAVRRVGPEGRPTLEEKEEEVRPTAMWHIGFFTFRSHHTVDGTHPPANRSYVSSNRPPTEAVSCSESLWGRVDGDGFGA